MILDPVYDEIELLSNLQAMLRKTLCLPLALLVDSDLTVVDTEPKHTCLGS
jgi:hypothetical protein